MSEVDQKCPECMNPIPPGAALPGDICSDCRRQEREVETDRMMREFEIRLPPSTFPKQKAIEINLVAEGKAIHDILTALGTLPGISVTRVVGAVSLLVDGARSEPMLDSRNIPFPSDIALEFLRAKDLFGDGDEEAP